MDKIDRLIVLTILKGEPLYKATNERIQLTEYYLRNPNEFNVDKFNQNASEEFRKLSLEGKIKRNRKPYQWVRTFEYLEDKIYIEYIIGKQLDVDKLNRLFKNKDIFDLYNRKD